MKKKNSLIRKYVEAIVYSIFLILSVYLCLVDNIYITMIPISFIIGIIGQILFGKKIMTSIFSAIIAIILLQMKAPALILDNSLITLKIFSLTVLGEIFGWSIKRFYRLSKKRRNITRKIRNEKIKCGSISLISFIVAIVFSSILNGNYFTFFSSRDSLKNYFINEYNSGSRFKVISANYIFSFNNPRYIFYAQDTLSNNVTGKFTVYLKDKDNIQDDYQEKVGDRVSRILNDNISQIYSDNEYINVFVSNSDTNMLTINFTKRIDSISKQEIEIYSKEVVNYIDTLKDITDFDKIEQIKLTLESLQYSQNSLSAYVFMSGYNNMLKSGNEEPFEYIMRALNFEYFD